MKTLTQQEVYDLIMDLVDDLSPIKIKRLIKELKKKIK